MTLSQARRSCYRLGAIIGDVQAARSPSTMARRIVRKSVYRSAFRALRKVT